MPGGALTMGPLAILPVVWPHTWSTHTPELRIRDYTDAYHQITKSQDSIVAMPGQHTPGFIKPMHRIRAFGRAYFHWLILLIVFHLIFLFYILETRETHSVSSPQQVDRITQPAYPEIPPHQPAARLKPDPGTAGSAVNGGESPLKQFSYLLKSGDYRTVLARFEEIYTTEDSITSLEYRKLLVDHAFHLIESKKPESAVALLEPFVTVFYNDTDALFTLGRAYRVLGNPQRAIQAYQQMFLAEHRTDVREMIQQQLDRVIGIEIRALKKQKDYRTIASTYKNLLQLQPYHPPYVFGLVDALVAQQSWSAALGWLATIKHDYKYGKLARTKMTDIEMQSRNQE